MAFIESPAFLSGAAFGVVAVLCAVAFFYSPEKKESPLEAIPFNLQTSPVAPAPKPFVSSLPVRSAPAAGDLGEHQEPSPDVARTEKDGAGSVDEEPREKGSAEKSADETGYGQTEVPPAEFSDLRGPGGGDQPSGAVSASPAAAAPAASRQDQEDLTDEEIASAVTGSEGGPIEGRVPGRVYSARTGGGSSARGSKGLAHFSNTLMAGGAGKGSSDQANYAPTAAMAGNTGSAALSGGGLVGGSLQSGTGLQPGGNPVVPIGGGEKKPEPPPAPIVPATPKEINAQAAKHLDIAVKYQAQVITPFIQLEKKDGSAYRTGIGKAMKTLKALDLYIQRLRAAQEKMGPEADGVLAELHELISGEGRSAVAGSSAGEFLRRLQTADKSIGSGLSEIGLLPNKCVFSVKKGSSVNLHNASALAHDRLNRGIEQAINVRGECLKAADAVLKEPLPLPILPGPSKPAEPKKFPSPAPVLPGPGDPGGVQKYIAAQLRLAASQITPVRKAAKVRGKVLGKPKTELAKRTWNFNIQIKRNCDTVQAKYPSYPDNATRNNLVAHVDASENSSGVAVNTLVARDQLPVDAKSLHSTSLSGDEAGRSYVRLCESYYELKTLAADAAKKQKPRPD
jgi:hypothetical protein